MSAAVNYEYQYPFASHLAQRPAGWGLLLATFGGAEQNPHFFEGRMRQPKLTADLLNLLADIVGTHFWKPIPWMALDPVVTSNDSMLRFEGFSACRGAYCRVDLPGGAFETELHRRGTTNVDFNREMRVSLSRIKDSDAVELGVGADEVVLTKRDTSVVEKKVKLPVRWVKGFAEVQAYMPGMELQLEVRAAEALRFVRSLPRGRGAKSAGYVVPASRGLRWSQRAGRKAIPLHGVNRLQVLEPILSRGKTLRVWADAASGASAWEVVYEQGRFLILISPELYRGFSGEGQVLTQLAGKDWEPALPHVQASLTWQSAIDSAKVASEAALSRQQVESALAALAARGLVGYDLETSAYFHRVLPFDLDKVDALQPRLKAAKELLEAGGVQLVSTDDDTIECLVRGTDVHHRVRLLPDSDRCTCQWFSKHQGQRGPCKHVLAAQMMVDTQETAE